MNKIDNNKPLSYEDAKKAGLVEYADTDVEPRTNMIRVINTLIALELRGIKLPEGGISGTEIDVLLKEVEKRGIKIPNTPFDKLSSIEVRAFTDSFEGKTNGLEFRPEDKRYSHFSLKMLELLAEQQKSKLSN